MVKVLLVDDEELLRTSLSSALKEEGFHVSTAATGAEALDQARAFFPDLILLDVMLPGIDGFEVCRRLRASSSETPIIFLTAKDRAADRVHGFETGGDDYVVKPFDTRELIARVHAVLRRRDQALRLLEEDRDLVARLEELVRRIPAASPDGGAEGGLLEAGPMRIDLDRSAVELDGEPLALAEIELRVLTVLVRRPRRVVTRTEILETVFGRAGPELLSILDAHIRVLREKIERNPAQPRLLQSVPGIGFIFEPD